MDLRWCTGCFCPAAPPRFRQPSTAPPYSPPAPCSWGCAAATQLGSDPELMDRASGW
uniref:Uncharacterized protein n=1 Tax=Arundo donax TaxID=35708 RepID=A0A0A9HEB8_ARUDO